MDRKSLLSVSVATLCLASLASAQHGVGTDPGRSTVAPPPQGTITLPNALELKIGGEYRLRYENLYNYDRNSDLGDENSFFTQRVRLNFALKITEHIDAYVQVQDVRNWGSEGGTTAAAAPGLDLKRGWVSIKDVAGVGGKGKIGRQVLSFGDQRLVGGLEWVSQGRTFDGYRHTWKEKDSYTVDAFFTQVTETLTAGVFDDAYFLGVYATVDSIENAEVDFYILHLSDDETALGGTESRTTLGLRGEHHAGKLETGVEVAAQTGEVDGADIPFGDAYALHLHSRLDFGADDKFWVKAEGNYASGNDPNSTDNERFKNLFPTAHMHWGMMDLALWENMLHGQLLVGTNIDKASKVTLAWNYFSSVEETDVFRGPNNNFGAAGAGGSSKIGNEIDLIFHKNFDTAPAKSYMQFGYGVFMPGAAALGAGGQDDMSHFVYAMGGITF